MKSLLARSGMWALTCVLGFVPFSPVSAAPLGWSAATLDYAPAIATPSFSAVRTWVSTGATTSNSMGYSTTTLAWFPVFATSAAADPPAVTTSAASTPSSTVTTASSATPATSVSSNSAGNANANANGGGAAAASVPEPGTYLLMLAGLLVILPARRFLMSDSK